MKNLEEKKLLVKMMRMFNQPVDPALVESIEREEKLNAILFGESKEEPVLEEDTDLLIESDPIEVVPNPDVLIEVVEELPLQPEKPAETGIVPPEEIRVKQVADYISAVSKLPPESPAVGNKELNDVKKAIADLLKKVNTLSWGGGGTGVVRIWDTDDFDRSSAANGRYMRWDNGIFSLDDVNPHDVKYNTTLVTTPTYTCTDDDYYVGVNYAGPTTIILPLIPDSGRVVIIKDESGHASTNPISVSGTVDNDAGGFIIQLDNGAIQLIYRNGWRII